jgi:hypothetical protein
MELTKEQEELIELLQAEMRTQSLRSKCDNNCLMRSKTGSSMKMIFDPLGNR